MSRTYRRTKHKYKCGRYCHLCNPNIWREDVRKTLKKEVQEELNAERQMHGICPNCGTRAKVYRYEGRPCCATCTTDLTPPEEM